MPQVTIIMGSLSDQEKMMPCFETLKYFGIEYEAFVSSAHRSPERTEKIITEQEVKGTKIFICAAGMAAHLAGAVAAHTACPVIGVPIASQALAGLDALLSTVQMPGGFPVATVALDKAGAKNAAWLAVQILAVADNELRFKLDQARRQMASDTEKASEELQEKLKLI